MYASNLMTQVSLNIFYLNSFFSTYESVIVPEDCLKSCRLLHSCVAAEGVSGGSCRLQRACRRRMWSVSCSCSSRIRSHTVVFLRSCRSVSCTTETQPSPQHPGRGTQVSNCVNFYVSLIKYEVITIKRLQVERFESDSCEFEHVKSSLF